MKKLIAIGSLLVLSGCATHANITTPYLAPVENEAWQGKTLGYDVYYAQPKPGLFSGGEDLPLAPIDEAELSVGSSTVLYRLPELIEKQLPNGANVTYGNSDTDYRLRIEMVAHDKLGPAYADYDAMISMGKSMLTLGLGASEYTLVADFDVTYRMTDGEGGLISEKAYQVAESVDHERGKLESISSTNDYAEKLLEKHLMITLNDFFTSTDLGQK